MRLTLLHVVVGLCGFALPLSAASGAIAGIVLDGLTKVPIRRAVVTLSTVGAPQDAVAWTDADGRFAFGYLPPGRYQMHAEKDGYRSSAFGAETPDRPSAIITLADGENRDDFVFRLQPLGTISGVVLDEDGDPVAGAHVEVLTPGFQRQKPVLLPGASNTTDSHGRYRLHVQAPGRYAVVARHMFQPAMRVQPEVAAGQSQPQYMYGTQYYPGTDRSASAALLIVRPGKEVEGINFRLTTRPTTALLGRVILPDGVTPSGGVSINALAQDLFQGVNMSTRAGAPDFVFRLDNLPAGAYLVVAQASTEGKQYRGIQRVELGGQATTGVTVPLEAGIDLAGRITVEGPDAAKHPAEYVALVAGDGVPWYGPPLRAKVNKDGAFKLANVVPGIWDINAGPIPPGGYIKSMRLGDQDVLTEEMAITSATTAPLKIVLNTQGASFAGDVTNGAEQPARAVVLLAPEGKFRNVLSFHQFTTSDEKGHFEIKGATPGNYRLYAFEELNANSIQDPEFLKPFERFGVRIQLKEGRNVSQRLTLIQGGVGESQ